MPPAALSMPDRREQCVTGQADCAGLGPRTLGPRPWSAILPPGCRPS